MNPRVAPIVALATVALAVAVAQEPSQRRVVPVTVTSVSGRTVYLDRGRSDGLRVGTRVRLFPPGVAPLELEVRASSSSSSRVDLLPGMPTPPVGSRGEAEASPTDESPPPTPARPAPAEHAPWTRQEPSRDAQQPLLVPTFSQPPDQRPTMWNGRVYGFSLWNHDNGAGGDADYLLARVGTSIEATNPVGAGGRLRTTAEYDLRHAEVPGRIDDSDGNLRVNQLSYATGTEDWAPAGVEVGRFLPRALPELGLLDGVEGLLKFDGGLRLGAGVGAYPIPYPELTSGDDLGFHVFADVGADRNSGVTAVLGYQKTWHEGTPDRDLLLLRVEGRPGGGFWYYAGAKVDIYTGSDDRKGAGVDLTELVAQGRWDGEDLGVGAGVNHFTWPDLLREEYRNLPDELVQDGRVDRVSTNGWWRVVDGMRLSGRADFWWDQDRDGTAVELAGDVDELFGSGIALYVAGLRSEGSYLSGPGARVRLRKRFGDVGTTLGWSWLRYDVEGLLSGPESYDRQTVDAGVDWTLGAVDVNLTFERWFGDQQDAWALAIYGQYRF